MTSRGYAPHWVFCHPDVLIAAPPTSLYYRGLTGLSQKAVTQLATSTANWENLDAKPLRSRGAAVKAACLFNIFISSIIKGSDAWVLENGYRTILATIGISFDGSFRNRIGEIAEERVQRLLIEFIISAGLAEREATQANPITLLGGITMHFSSEPDVYFQDAEGHTIATIEVKGGLDPAAALERLGASQKSFLKATRALARCQTYLVAGVITAEMEERLNQDRQFTKHFSLVDILADEDSRASFLTEVFHHGLRFELQESVRRNV